MAATIGGAELQHDGDNSSTTITLSGYTPPAGDDKILTVGISSEDTGGVIPEVTGVTFGGVAMDIRQSQDAASQNSIYVFDRQIGSSTTSGDIVATVDVGCGYTLHVFCVIDAAQQAPEASVSAAADNDDITTVTDGAMVIALHSTGGSTDAAPDTGITEINEISTSGGNTFYSAMGYKEVVTAGSTTMEWVSGSGTRPMICALAYEAAGAGGGPYSELLGIAFETDSALSINAVKSAPLGIATEVDTAFAIASSRAKAIGIATESDVAIALRVIKSAALGTVSETDTTFSMGHSRARLLGLATETDTALPFVGGAVAAILKMTKLHLGMRIGL